jgi:phosphatidylserine decarboxylase
MSKVTFFDRKTRALCREKIYGEFFLRLLYGDGLFRCVLSKFLTLCVAEWQLTSRLYGWLQKTPFSRAKIRPFIREFEIDVEEFLNPIESFSCFNDFFIRTLKPSARPIAPGNDIAVLPADGRVLVFQNLAECDGFFIKGQKFSLSDFLLDETLSAQYAQGAIVIIRLAPCDYHRFHFPFNCIPHISEFIDGALYSVNPIALRKNIAILSKNKRQRTALFSKAFHQVQYIEIGATHVGTIHQTFIPHEPYAKGDEKGYFSFGGSCIVLLFTPGSIQFDHDLIASSQRNIETRCLMGQTLGRALQQ